MKIFKNQNNDLLKIIDIRNNQINEDNIMNELENEKIKNKLLKEKKENEYYSLIYSQKIEKLISHKIFDNKIYENLSIYFKKIAYLENLIESIKFHFSALKKER